MDEISKHFKQPHRAIETRGTQEGLILQFRCYYLKFYPTAEGALMVYGYRYYNPMPFFEKYIPYGSLRTFANSFNINDYADIEFDDIEEQLDSLEEPPYCIRA